MLVRGMTVLVAGIMTLSAGAALAETPSDPAGQPPPSPLALTVYDRAIDPATAAIRAVLADGLAEGVFESKSDAEAIGAYYAAQGYAPSWTSEGKFGGRGLALIDRIYQADQDGLDPASYRLPSAAIGRSQPADPAALARADVMLSVAVVSYARHAFAGRLDPSSISPNFGYEIRRPEPGAILGLVAASPDPVATLVAYNPPQPEFAALREKLAELRKAGEAAVPVEVPAGPALKPGMSDPRVPLLRERLGLAAATTDADLYDDALVEAVKAFQTSSKLRPDGIIGNGTLAVLNRKPESPIATVLANMERWRWMPRDLGRFYVHVNIPTFDLEVYKDGGVIHTTRIVVGKVTNQTPIFSDEIEHIVVNPVWNVPASIAVKEMLPAIRARGGNIGGYQVYAKVKGRFRLVDPRMINWQTVDMRNIQIKQPPGERNALGSVKFMFPNPYSVYLHDTPSKALFQRDYRAYSHGCMRVENPMNFADVLLSEEPGWNAARLKKLIGGPERRVDLSHHIPVHITYFTASVDPEGKLQVSEDLYGHDKRIFKALNL